MPMRCRVPRVLVLVVLLAALPLGAQDLGGLPAEKLAEIEKAITAEMARQNIPGLSVAVVTAHQLRWANGYGLADLENFVPAKASTVYRLGSISKPITATAVMQLAEKGRLDLDAAIQKYVAGFPEKPWPVTARQLLGHLSGVRHYRNEEEVNSTRHYLNLADALHIFKDDPLLFEPGARFSYTTYGYTLLGCAVETASGMKFVDYARENIFRRAGMDTMRADDVYAIIPNRAQGYRKTQSGELRNSALADTSNKIPGGGFCSTVNDLAKFAIAVQTGDLVKKDTLELMWTRQKTRDGQLTNYGLGWGVGERNGLKEVGHSGGQPRVSTYLLMVPQKGVAVVIMSNLEASRLRELARQIGDIAAR